jgi:SOS-response transcriptional repressor LexA
VLTLLRALDDELGAISDYDIFSALAVARYEALNEWQRELLLDVLGDLTSRHQVTTSPLPTPIRLPIFLEIPANPVAESIAEACAWHTLPPGEYAPSYYGLLIAGNDGHPRIEDGDLLVIDEARQPVNGDLVAILPTTGGAIRRYLDLGQCIELAPINPQFPPQQMSYEQSHAYPLRGVVVRLIRDLG